MEHLFHQLNFIKLTLHSHYYRIAFRNDTVYCEHLPDIARRGAAQLHSTTIIAPKSPFLCVYWSPIRYGRHLTIRQRRGWKIDFASFTTFSPLYQVTQLLERREVRLELKRGDRVRFQREKVKFITLPFPFSRCSCAGMAKKCTKKRDARVELLFCSLNLLLFWRSRCRRRRSFVRSRRKSYPLSLKYYVWVLANWLSALSFLSRWWTESKVATVFHRLWYVMATCCFHNF